MIAHLSSYLIKSSLLSPRKVERVLQYQVIKGGTLDTIILELNYLTIDDLSKYIFEAHKNDQYFFIKDNFKVNINIVNSAPKEIINRYHTLPIDIDDENIYIFVKTNITQNTINYLTKKYEKNIRYHVIPEVLFEYLLTVFKWKTASSRFEKLFSPILNTLLKYEIITENSNNNIFSPKKDLQTSIKTDMNDMTIPKADEIKNKESKVTYDSFQDEELNSFDKIIKKNDWSYADLERSLKDADSRDLIFDIFTSYFLTEYYRVLFIGKSKTGFKLVKYIFSDRDLTPKIELSFNPEESKILNNLSPKQICKTAKVEEDNTILNVYKSISKKVENRDLPNQFILFPIFIKGRLIGVYLIDSGKIDIKDKDINHFVDLSSILKDTLEDFILRKKMGNNNKDEVLLSKTLQKIENNTEDSDVVAEKVIPIPDIVKDVKNIDEKIYKENDFIDEEKSTKIPESMFNITKDNPPAYIPEIKKPIEEEIIEEKPEETPIEIKVEPVQEEIIEEKFEEIPVEIKVEPVQEEIIEEKSEEIPVEIKVEPVQKEIIEEKSEETPVEIKVEPVQEEIIEEKSEEIPVEPDQFGFEFDIEVEHQTPTTIELNLTEEEIAGKDIEENTGIRKDKLFTFFEILNGSKRNEIDEVVRDGDPRIKGEMVIDMIVRFFPGKLWLSDIEKFNFMTPVQYHGPLLYYITQQKNLNFDFLHEFFNDRDLTKKFYSVYLFTIIKYEDIIPFLIKKVTDTDSRISHAACLALSNHKLFKMYEKIKFKFESAIHSNMRSIVNGWLAAVKILRDEFFIPILIDGLEVWKGDKVIKKNIGDILVDLTKNPLKDSYKKWSKWWQKNQYKTRKEWILEGLQSKDRNIRVSSYYEGKKIFKNMFGYGVDLSKKQIQFIIAKIERNEEKNKF